MRSEIIRFIQKVKKRYKGTEAIYIPENDTYSIRYRGMGVQNFDTNRFYQIPRAHRMKMILPLIKVGLNHNFGEKYKNQLYLHRKLGKKIT